jgi:hypothetical protein
LLPPAKGKTLTCEYRRLRDSAAPTLDIATAGSGVLQVLLDQFGKSRYFEIAQCFQPTKVHPEILEKPALLKFAFGTGPELRQPVGPAAGDEHA